MIDAFHIAAERPWLIQAESLQTILAIADRMGNPEALQSRDGKPLENARTVQMRDGVAVIPVTGPIFRYANLFTAISGATSTGVLAKDIQAALDNRFVKAIVLDINSPGGEATGINELAQMIFDARGQKPITAYIGGSGASAAYWIASAADKIVADPTAIVGSIGVVMSYLDTAERDAKSGTRVIEVVSSQSPDKRTPPTTDEGRAKVQTIVDALADVFVGSVARNRGVTTQAVLNDFGRGGVMVGDAAKRAGMVDRIGSLESVIAELAGSASKPQRSFSMASNTTVTVSNTDDLRTALAAGYTADQIVIKQPDNAASVAAVAAARAEGEQAGREAGAAGAALAERQRISKIQALARRGFDAELKAAIDNGDTPETFAMALLTAAADRGITLDAISKDAPPPAPHAKPEDGGKKTASVNSSDIYAARAAAVNKE